TRAAVIAETSINEINFFISCFPFFEKTAVELPEAAYPTSGSSVHLMIIYFSFKKVYMLIK
ncbi:MAG: hypothetical protein IIY96_06655, partial [Lachnospiraceae bacterium]|nr:hypothetical protein [Lachnospiraceae bacterium]